MDFLKLAEERYSVRKMKNERVKQEDLNKILEAARLSPTAKNLQRQTTRQDWQQQVLSHPTSAHSCT